MNRQNYRRGNLQFGIPIGRNIDLSVLGDIYKTLGGQIFLLNYHVARLHGEQNLEGIQARQWQEKEWDWVIVHTNVLSSDIISIGATGFRIFTFAEIWISGI